MKFKKEWRECLIYVVLGILTLPLGIATLAVTILKSVYYETGPIIVFGFLKVFAARTYQDHSFVQWLWPWMSVAKLDNKIGIFLCPSFVIGGALMIVSGYLFRNAKRLITWMKEEKELLKKERMRDSLRSSSVRQSQSTGAIQAGRDAVVNQAITNHYNHRPDNPKAPIIVAVIGLVGAVISAIIGLGKGH